MEIDLLKQNVYRYDEIECTIKKIREQIKPLQEHIKQLAKQKKEMQQNICKLMDNINIGVCNIPEIDGRTPYALKYTVLNTPLPMSSAHIKELLMLYFNNYDENEFNKLTSSDKALDVFNFLYNKENRHKKERESLRKIKYMSN